MTASIETSPMTFLALRGACATVLYTYVGGDRDRYFAGVPPWSSNLGIVEAGRAYWVGWSC